MKKLLKKGIMAVAMAAMLFTLPATGITAKADAVSADPSDVYVSLGADLNETERATVLGLLGITEDDLATYTVGQITNAEEHKYLGEYLDASVIGTRALSSVMVVLGEEGEGINVTTKNINYCTSGMYVNALITAGVENAEVVVAGPFEITGTAALVGAMKAYADLTGTVISAESMDAAVDELIVTSSLAESVTTGSENIEDLIAYVKAEVVENGLDDEESIRKVIQEGATQLGITITPEEENAIVSLMKKISELDLDADAIKAQAEELYNKLEEMGITEESAKNFLQKLIDAISNFFQSIFG